MKKALKVIFLGGVGEIGKNMTAIEYGDDIIIIDAGLSFPTGEMPGVDLVIPDITYLEQNFDRVRGIFITHGHEDHIGALPFVLEKIMVPVYGTKLTLTLIENKLIERKVNHSTLFCVKAGSVINVGCFSVEFIAMTHSISGCCALAVRTPAGVVFHTGDFKVDYTPIMGECMDFKRLAELGDRGVLLMLCESTNVEREGYTMSEKTVGNALDEIFNDNQGRRLFVATFSSNIHRIQQVVNLAKKYKRKICFSGRSMINIAENASKIGELDIDKSIIVPIDKNKNYLDSEIVIISTGSQGEPMSALTRMSQDDFHNIKIGDNDTVIISASPIPGNEKMVYNVVNNLYRKGARVIYSMLADVHVSGHACLEELKLMHRLIKPKYFIPVHGEYRHLKQHQELAVNLGMEEKNIFIPDIGSVVEVSRNKMIQRPNVPAGALLVDGLGFGDLDSVVLRDRRHLAEDGLVVAVVGIDSVSRQITSKPDIISRGVVFANEYDALMEEARKIVVDTIVKLEKQQFIDQVIRDAIRKSLKTFFFKRVKCSPIIIPIVMSN